VVVDDTELAARLRELLQRHRDPELHQAVADHRAGLIDRQRLFTHPSFVSAMAEDTRALRQGLAEHDLTPERLRERLISALRDAGEYPPEPGRPDMVAPLEPDAAAQD
jgi:hypothetical protein